jgi:hypothetical protein
VREGASWAKKLHTGYDPGFNVAIVHSRTALIFIATKYPFVVFLVSEDFSALSWDSALIRL